MKINQRRLITAHLLLKALQTTSGTSLLEEEQCNHTICFFPSRLHLDCLLLDFDREGMGACSRGYAEVESEGH